MAERGVNDVQFYSEIVPDELRGIVSICQYAADSRRCHENELGLRLPEVLFDGLAISIVDCRVGRLKNVFISLIPKTPHDCATREAPGSADKVPAIGFHRPVAP